MRRNLPLSIGAGRVGAVRSIVKPIGRHAGEILLTAALLAGWTLITLAIARLARPDVVWPFSSGLLCLTAGGRRIISAITGQGLYALMKEPDA